MLVLGSGRQSWCDQRRCSWLTHPLANRALFFIKGQPQENNRFPPAAIGQIIATRFDLIERDLCTAQLEFEDVNFVGQFLARHQRARGWSAAPPDRKAQQFEHQIDD